MAGLFDIAEPIPATASRHGLIASAFPGNGPGRWELGITVCPENCVETSTWDPDCAAWPLGEPPLKSAAAANLDCYDVLPFILESPFECSSTGFKTLDYAGRARRQLEAGSPKALEYELWTGELMGAQGNPNLVTGSTTIAGGVAQPPLRALALLEQALANCAHGGRGMIHSPSFIVNDWEDVIEKDGARLVTMNRGDIVVSGDGYPGTGPGGITPAEGTMWIYATGPVQYRMSEVLMYPNTMAEALDRKRNRVEYRAERMAMVNFDPCCHFAVLVDVTQVGAASGSSGGTSGPVALDAPTIATLTAPVALDAPTIATLTAGSSSDATPTPITAGAVAGATGLSGWSLRNTFAGLTKLRLHFGPDATGADFIPINLAENETVTDVFANGLTVTDGLFVEIVAGTVDGVLYIGTV